MLTVPLNCTYFFCNKIAIEVIREVQLFWQKARIPMRRTDHAVEQLEELVKKWKAVKKNKARRTVTQVAYLM